MKRFAFAPAAEKVPPAIVIAATEPPPLAMKVVLL
jgi:hypothetical protein